MKCFILLGHGRTGSTLIVRSLTEHPNVRMFGELFHYTPEERERAFHALNKKFGPGREETDFKILEKMAKRKPREQIVNYEEFKEHFRNTLYENFFE